MRFDWINDKSAPPCRVINLDTGEHITFCFLADEETGEFGRYDRDANGKWHLGEDGRIGRIYGKCRLKIVPLKKGESYFWEREMTDEIFQKIQYNTLEITRPKGCRTEFSKVGVYSQDPTPVILYEQITVKIFPNDTEGPKQKQG